jgi:glycerol uptake facilitator-like aquaporin
MTASLSRRVAAELLGTGFLVAAVIGSGIMAERLAAGNAALALLANTLATSAALVCLIQVFLPISGAHFNPVVTICDLLRGGMRAPEAALYAAAQVAGGLAGTACANLMFALPLFSQSHRMRTGPAQWFSEAAASFGLILAIRICARVAPRQLPLVVAAYIGAAYWFTASTAFANPAVTIARCLSDTFAGIRPADVPGFVAAQLAGGLGALAVSEWLAGHLPAPRLEP